MPPLLVTAEGARLGDVAMPVAVGRGAIGRKGGEGDGITPIGRHTVTGVLFRADRVAPPSAPWPVCPIRPHDGWCDDPTAADYNALIRLPFPHGYERLWRADGLYDVIAILDWNRLPVVTGAGSAIFLHCAAPELTPTEGCVALRRNDLIATLAAMTAKDSVHVVG